MSELTGIERYFLQQQVARLHDLRARLAGKIGMCEAESIVAWYIAVKDVGCPNCGIDFTKTPPETNIYMHWTGGCRED
jgi:hypothetical protein